MGSRSHLPRTGTPLATSESTPFLQPQTWQQTTLTDTSEHTQNTTTHTTIPHYRVINRGG